MTFMTQTAHDAANCRARKVYVRANLIHGIAHVQARITLAFRALPQLLASTPIALGQTRSATMEKFATLVAVVGTAQSNAPATTAALHVPLPREQLHGIQVPQRLWPHACRPGRRVLPRNARLCQSEHQQTNNSTLTRTNSQHRHTHPFGQVRGAVEHQ